MVRLSARVRGRRSCQLSPVDRAIELVDIIIDVHGPEFGNPDEDEHDD
ncbi:MAG TPA: hypothetical protein VHN80_03940 [Kineosporiaceae bacterium]|nr:hypothetical protein [Kineosporiaceae bacterium]